MKERKYFNASSLGKNTLQCIVFLLSREEIF